VVHRSAAGTPRVSLLTAKGSLLGIDLFGLTPTDNRNRFTWSPSPLLYTPANSLQGGAALGAAITAIETVTGRPTVWATAQYLSYAVGTEPLDLDVSIEVAGYNTTQARCVVSRDGREILTAHAACGSRTAEVTGMWCQRPEVPPPGACERYRYFEHDRGLGALVEHRLALGRQLHEVEGRQGSGHSALWIRSWQGSRMVTTADVSFIGDFMPMGFADALGAPYAGNSLDNTVRIGELAPTEWILLSTHIDHVVNGFGRGRAELWTEDGTLLGDVSQTAVMRKHARIRAKDPDAN
jgi:acyl-CoA thioesterase II